MFATSMTLLFCVDMIWNCIFVCDVDVNNKWPHITITMQTCVDVATHFEHTTCFCKGEVVGCIGSDENVVD